METEIVTEKKQRLQAIAAALAAIGNLAEPCFETARSNLLAEQRQIEQALVAAKPLRTQLRAALNKLQKGLAATKSFYEEIQQLEVVLEARKTAFLEAKADALHHQAAVAQLAELVRHEELAAVAALAPAGGGPAAAPGDAAGRRQFPATLFEWAAGFAANCPPAVARCFEAFLSQQDAALTAASTAAVAGVGAGWTAANAAGFIGVGTGGGEAAHVDEEEDTLGDSLLAAAIAAGGAATLAARPGGSALATPRPADSAGGAMLGFGRVRQTRARDDPYGGGVRLEDAMSLAA